MCVPLSFQHWCTITFRPTCRLMHMQYWPVFIYIYTSSVFVDLYSAINKNHFSKSWSFILFIFFLVEVFFLKWQAGFRERERAQYLIWLCVQCIRFYFKFIRYSDSKEECDKLAWSNLLLQYERDNDHIDTFSKIK